LKEANANLTDLLIGHYGERYGVTVTAEALRRIQRRDLADGLVGDDGEMSEVATVAAGSTPQDQMRQLLATAPAWGRRGHRDVLHAMRCLHPCLMEELEGSGGSLQWE
ncbi:uncharacterized protein RDI95_012392, partial [Morus bassanus]